jgi:FkbM family methyltransferase
MIASLRKSSIYRRLSALRNKLSAPQDAVPAIASAPTWQQFVTLCSHFNIHTITVRSSLGDITGSPQDRAVFEKFILSPSYNAGLIDLLRSTLTAGGTFLDIGANIGLITLQVADLPNVKCIAFEPEPRNFGYLMQNCAGRPNIELRQVALCDSTSYITFELSNDNFGDHRVYRNANDVGYYNEATWQHISVPGTTLDAAVDLESARRPIVVKIDTQGAEPLVFAGGTMTLAKADLIAFEVWPYGARRLNRSYTEIGPFILDHFEDGRIGHFDESTIQDWLPIRDLWRRAEECLNSIDGIEWFDVCVRKRA